MNLFFSPGLPIFLGGFCSSVLPRLRRRRPLGPGGQALRRRLGAGAAKGGAAAGGATGGGKWCEKGGFGGQRWLGTVFFFNILFCGVYGF